MTRNALTHTPARRVGLLAALASFALMVAPATGLAKAPVKFGAKLDPTVQPSNSLPAHPCSQDAPGTPCTFVLNEAYGRPDGGEFAPRSGTIKKIRLIAGGPGSFRLQIARVKPNQRAKVTANGPKIFYEGQTEANFESSNYQVESFDVNVPVHKGEQLALRGSFTSMLRCSSGGDNTLIYQPPLRLGNPFQPVSDTDGCWILMEAVIR